MNEVEEFISRRWADNNGNFLNGNCYWFAKILVIRFPYLKIYYLPTEGHFVAGIDNTYYDCTGHVLLKEEPVSLEEIENTDKLWYNRIYRDCIM